MSDRPELLGWKILVTGAASGIGRRIAELATARGAAVAWLDRDAAGLEAAAGDGVRVVCDLTRPNRIEAAIPDAIARLGGLDGLVNAAGIAGTNDALTIAPEEWQRFLAINLTAPFWTARVAHPALAASGRGSVVNISSASALRPHGAGAAYVASKGGLLALTKSLAGAWAPAVRVNAICPGSVDTPMLDQVRRERPETIGRIEASYPMQRIATATEIAEAALFLLGDRSGFTTGSTLAVDGGRTMH